MIIGGAAIFNQTIEYASCVYLTLIHANFDADVHFPKLDKSLWIRQKIFFNQKMKKIIMILLFTAMNVRVGQLKNLIVMNRHFW